MKSGRLDRGRAVSELQHRSSSFFFCGSGRHGAAARLLLAGAPAVHSPSPSPFSLGASASPRLPRDPGRNVDHRRRNGVLHPVSDTSWGTARRRRRRAGAAGGLFVLRGSGHRGQPRRVFFCGTFTAGRSRRPPRRRRRGRRRLLSLSSSSTTASGSSIVFRRRSCAARVSAYRPRPRGERLVDVLGRRPQLGPRQTVGDPRAPRAFFSPTFLVRRARRLCRLRRPTSPPCRRRSPDRASRSR